MDKAVSRVLLIASDPAFARALGRLLRPRFAVEPFDSCDAFAAHAAATLTAGDLVLIDDESLPTLPDWGWRLTAVQHPGAEAEQKLPPVLVLGRAPASLAPPADSVGKPIRVTELIAAIDRLRAATIEKAITIGPYVYHRLERRLTQQAAGETVELTEKEAALLDALVAARGTAVPRDRLLYDIWGYGDAIDTHTLETHIYRLRRKLQPGRAAVDEVARSLIHSELGGYRLDV